MVGVSHKEGEREGKINHLSNLADRNTLLLALAKSTIIQCCASKRCLLARSDYLTLVYSERNALGGLVLTEV